MRVGLIRILAPLALGLLTLNACALKQIPMTDHFVSTESKKIGIVSEPYPEAAYYRVGSLGTKKIKESDTVDSDLVTRVKSVDLGKAFKERFEQEILNTVAPSSDEVLILDSESIAGLDTYWSDDDDVNYIEFANLDYRQFRRQGLDYLIVIKPLRLGLTRGYYGLVPLGEPTGHSSLRFDVVDLKTNKIVWRETRETDAKIAGEWDLPPSFDGAVLAVNSSFERTMEKLVLTMRNKLANQVKVQPEPAPEQGPAPLEEVEETKTQALSEQEAVPPAAKDETLGH